MSSKVGKVHPVAREGFTEGNHYDKSRPTYTDELVAHVIESLLLAPHNETRYDVLELGAGTGIFTRKFLELWSPEDKIRYLASDPSEGFLTVLKEKSPEMETVVCSADRIPLPDCSVKNAVCAQSFHWFADKESLQEIWRVLVPGGRLILVWNDRDGDVEYVRKLLDLFTMYLGDAPRKMSGKWMNVFDNCNLFRCIEHTPMAGVKGTTGNKDFVVDHFTSISVIACLGPDKKKKAVEQCRALLDELFPEDEEIEIPFKSDFYCAEKNILK